LRVCASCLAPNCTPWRKPGRICRHEGRPGKKKIGLKLFQRVANRAQSLFFLFVKVVVTASQGRVLNTVILQRVFDHRACADGTGYEKHLLPGLFFTAVLGKELI
jgi:hypothetical protein